MVFKPHVKTLEASISNFPSFSSIELVSPLTNNQLEYDPLTQIEWHLANTRTDALTQNTNSLIEIAPLKTGKCQKDPLLQSDSSLALVLEYVQIWPTLHELHPLIKWVKCNRWVQYDRIMVYISLKIKNHLKHILLSYFIFFFDTVQLFDNENVTNISCKN